MEKKVYIVDATNRDGVQASRMLIPKLAKTMLNIYLDRMGIWQSEMGFPTLRHETNYINANLELAAAGAIKNMRLEGWCRAVTEDIENAFLNCPGIRHLNISIPTSKTMISAKFQGRKNWKNIIELLVEAVTVAKSRGLMSLGIGAEDASRTEPDRLIEFALAGKKAGADRFRYSDTIGLEEPLSIYQKIKSIARETRMPMEMHCHNDLGMAVAVSVSGARGAIEAGVDAYIDTVINGYGERSGNCDLVSTLLAIKYSPSLKGSLLPGSNIDLAQAWSLSSYASYAFNTPIPVNQPGVGANVFAHESGIHVDGVLKDIRSYELVNPGDVGRGKPLSVETGRIITTGAYGGMKGFRHVCGRLGIEFCDDDAARRALELVQYANLHTQKPLTDDEIRFIADYPDIAADILTVTP
jgi:isopropylmalate/homocitrate/citramalate synthase